MIYENPYFIVLIFISLSGYLIFSRFNINKSYRQHLDSDSKP